MRILAALILGLALCNVAQAQPSSPASAPAAGQPAVATDSDYTLGATDKVRVIVYDEPTLSGEFVVSGTGTIAFPLIGDIRAGGQSVPALQEQIRSRLADGYLRDPKVSVEVLTFRPFYILGEVGKPGQYPYTDGLTVMNAVATAGGFTYRAEKKRIFVRHASETKESLVTLAPTTQVQPGDTIRIRERYF